MPNFTSNMWGNPKKSMLNLRSDSTAFLGLSSWVKPSETANLMEKPLCPHRQLLQSKMVTSSTAWLSLGQEGSRGHHTPECVAKGLRVSWASAPQIPNPSTCYIPNAWARVGTWPLALNRSRIMMRMCNHRGLPGQGDWKPVRAQWMPVTSFPCWWRPWHQVCSHHWCCTGQMCIWYSSLRMKRDLLLPPTGNVQIRKRMGGEKVSEFELYLSKVTLKMSVLCFLSLGRNEVESNRK